MRVMFYLSQIKNVELILLYFIYCSCW